MVPTHYMAVSNGHSYLIDFLKGKVGVVMEFPNLSHSRGSRCTEEDFTSKECQAAD